MCAEGFCVGFAVFLAVADESAGMECCKIRGRFAGNCMDVSSPISFSSNQLVDEEKLLITGPLI
jgi:hypothetical protein